ncbi:MAG: acyl-CoA dehydrogenase family protein [Salinirussus sp.]
MPPSNLTDLQRDIVAAAEDVAGAFEDRAFEWQGDTPWENIELLANQGLWAMAIPEEYGGGGLSVIEDILVTEAIAPVCPDTGWALLNASVSPRYVAQFGTEAAKERYLPPVANGESEMCIAISEPGAGSDVGGMRTRLESDGDGYTLHGEKTWITNYDTSEAAVVWARLPDGEIGSVVLDLDAPGVEIVDRTTNMAGHVQTHFAMDGARVPEENVLITDRDDWRTQLKRLNWDRVAIAMWTNALARTAIERAVEYATEREQFGQPIGEFQGLRWKIADMVAEYEAGRGLVYRAIERARAEDRVPTRLESSLAKFHTAERTERIVSEALQVFGANGYQQGHPLEYLHRFNRSRRIGHGTDEILKNGIADAVFDSGLMK